MSEYLITVPEWSEGRVNNPKRLMQLYTSYKYPELNRVKFQVLTVLPGWDGVTCKICQERAECVDQVLRKKQIPFRWSGYGDYRVGGFVVLDLPESMRLYVDPSLPFEEIDEVSGIAYNAEKKEKLTKLYAKCVFDLLLNKVQEWLSDSLELELVRGGEVEDEDEEEEEKGRGLRPYKIRTMPWASTCYYVRNRKEWVFDERGVVLQKLERWNKKFLPYHLEMYQKRQAEQLKYTKHWYLNQEGEKLNVVSTSSDWRAHCLSNFAALPFVLDGVVYASVEGFIQGIKYPFDHPNRVKAFNFHGKEAKRLGEEAKRRFVWCGREKIRFGSLDHYRLIERAIRAKFEQNAGAMAALKATEKMILVHDTGEPKKPDTSLPADIFCDILTRIREDISPKYTLGYLALEEKK